MSELKKIQVSLAKDGRKAYFFAKKNNNAYVLSGNRICKVNSDGHKEYLFELPKTKVLIRDKKFAI